MASTVIRTWTRRSVIVTTLHPQYGELTRGRIEPATAADTQTRGAWRLVDQDYCDQGVIIGDYLDAEARLLEISAWADELDSDPLSFEEEDQKAATGPVDGSQDGQEAPGKTLTREILGEDIWPNYRPTVIEGKPAQPVRQPIAPATHSAQPGRRSSLLEHPGR